MTRLAPVRSAQEGYTAANLESARIIASNPAKSRCAWDRRRRIPHLLADMCSEVGGLHALRHVRVWAHQRIEDAIQFASHKGNPREPQRMLHRRYRTGQHLQVPRPLPAALNQ